VSFNAVKGHERQIDVLRQSMKSGRVAHAYLFAGLEGIGKRLVAQSFAQAINCRKKPDEGCGQCSSCLKIAQQIHPDYLCLEPEDGSIKIDQIRELQSRMAYYPFEGKRKVIIVNDAEKMTPQAGNCLLKSLEEPPPDTVFILITQELRALLSTIVSRCQIIRFLPLPPHLIQHTIEERFGRREGMTDVLISLSGGSLGRACMMMEGDFLLERAKLFDRVTGLSDESISATLSLAGEFASMKDEAEKKLELLKTWYHDLMVCKRRGLQERVVNADLIEKIKEESSRFTLKDLLAKWRVVRDAQYLLRRNVNTQVAMEQMLIALTGQQE
jgi:DNA polymerase-3 subunit delta'